MSVYKNISGDTAIDLEIESSYTSNSIISNIILCNIHSSDSVNVDLYLYKKEFTDTRSQVGEKGNWDPLTSTISIYYILKNVVMPTGTTLFLDNSYLKFDKNKYSLYIKLNNSDSTVDIILN